MTKKKVKKTKKMLSPEERFEKTLHKWKQRKLKRRNGVIVPYPKAQKEALAIAFSAKKSRRGKWKRPKNRGRP